MTAFPADTGKTDLWGIYDNVLKQAKYVDLTHAFSPPPAHFNPYGATISDLPAG